MKPSEEKAATTAVFHFLTSLFLEMNGRCGWRGVFGGDEIEAEVNKKREIAPNDG